MNWYDFADKDDVDSNNLYVKMIEKKQAALGDSFRAWVKVPRRLQHNFVEGVHSDDIPLWWNGFEHIKVISYRSNKNRVYIRLPFWGEIAE
ncbi:Uncharacterised protein [Mycobacteroides abscessus subsp. massiliense]|uniref:hypothetical protein n=1 Tax=Mycobacteroides abscessus TaxID=36809 RepID=UPI0009CAFEBE|nr:hypothetical protein [Mycobacteroides abscessus]MBL3744686.1 hypothetical protein [Mycobacteroides abscessus subsp. massiliense]SKM98728.1 Uncharacterised protein [Mycobacteroides abscessus subsp. massiliense]